jgi:hypothetical protein
MFGLVAHLYGHAHDTCNDMSKLYTWQYTYDPMDIEFNDGYLQQRSGPSLGFGVNDNRSYLQRSNHEIDKSIRIRPYPVIDINCIQNSNNLSIRPLINTKK